MNLNIYCSVILFIYGVKSIVPEPFEIKYEKEYFRIPYDILIHNNYSKCSIIDDAIRRFKEDLRKPKLIILMNNTESRVLRQISIQIQNPCAEMPDLYSKQSINAEAYSIYIKSETGMIAAITEFGLFHAFQTLLQLTTSNQYGSRILPGVIISDRPRFPFRSFLIDTSRHYLPVTKILQFLDAMASVKFNVLHWHITDDQSFPLQLLFAGNISLQGSYDPQVAVYTPADVKHIQEYAGQRGINVIPEIDTPGHTLSWGRGYPELLTDCYTGENINGNKGPIDPTKITTYQFMKNLFREVADRFASPYLHIGGDEVDFTCWKSNPQVRDFMNSMKFEGDYAKLENYYITKLLEILKEIQIKTIKPIVWQEVFDNSADLETDVIVHLWIKTNWQNTLLNVLNKGHPVLFSSCWYLNYISYGEDWMDAYKCDPASIINPHQEGLLLGGGATMWGEFVDETNIMQRSWPRGAAVAERLWSAGSVTDANNFRGRLTDLRCQMLGNGIETEPVTGPGFCALI